MRDFNKFRNANLFIRLIAAGIDYVIIVLINVIFFYISSFILWEGLNITMQESIKYFSIFSIITFCIIYVLYYTKLDSEKYKGSVGKRFMKIVVISDDGNFLSKKKAFLRSFAKIIFILLIPGYLTIFFNQRRKTCHDYVSKTIVIRGEK